MTACTLVLEGELCDCLTIASDITYSRAVEMWLEETALVLVLHTSAKTPARI